MKIEDCRHAAMARGALVIDHPAEHFARALQLLADEPGLRVRAYWSTQERG